MVICREHSVSGCSVSVLGASSGYGDRQELELKDVVGTNPWYQSAILLKRRVLGDVRGRVELNEPTHTYRVSAECPHTECLHLLLI